MRLARLAGILLLAVLTACTGARAARPAPAPPSCVCPLFYQPVCGVDGKTYSNTCAAGCAGVAVDYNGECAPAVGECICTQEYAPVCGVDGQTYSNKCFADCANVAVASTGECRGVSAPGCSCEEVIDVVCGRDGSTYANACEAKCAGTRVAYTGPCGSKSSSCGVCDSVSQLWDPICVTSSSSKTYANPCYAQCLGGAKDSSDYYKGTCKPECDAKCSQDVSGIVCCGKGAEFPNACYATCVQGFQDPATQCTSGICTGDRAVALLNAECPYGGAQALCIRDPCDGIRCPGYPKATCFGNYCTKYFRLQELGICAAIWLNYATGELVASCTTSG